MIFAILILIIASVTLVFLGVFSSFAGKLQTWKENKDKVLDKELDNIFYDKNPQKIKQLYYILPVVLGVVSFILLRSLLASIPAAIIGLFIPNFIVKIKNNQRRSKFNGQILDAIMILSSSLKGGLSLLQALEVLAEEMPSPMSQEIALLIRENKMGIRLEDAFKHLNDRMKLEELTLLVNAILVARETGGDLTKVFSRLSVTIRDNRKLKDNIRTLTLQGRMQGIIMSALPFLFVWWVVTFNRHHFDIMLQSETGRMLLFIAIFLQAVGIFLIKKFSTIKF